jgi:uncharacterized protein YegJ (DUF2314 family)
MRCRFVLLIILCAIVSSCSRPGKSAATPEKPSFPAGEPMADSIHFTYSVYLLPGHSNGKQSITFSNQLLRTQYKALSLVKEIPEQAAHLEKSFISVHLEDNVQENYAPPTLESLRYRGEGLSPQQEGQLQKSHEAIILQFAYPKENVWDSLFAATHLAEDLARKTNGLILDEETRQVFTPEAWHTRRLASWIEKTPELANQFTIDIYPTNEYMRAITLGMAKFGLPDLVVQEIPHSSTKQAEDLIDIFAQALVEGGGIVPNSGKFKLDIHRIRNDHLRNSKLKSLKKHASGTACLLLKPGKREEGDPENRLMELSAEVYSGPDPQARQDNILSSLLGWEDIAHNVEHTPEVLAERDRERAKLPALHKAFNAGLQPGEYIQVKAPFTIPGRGHEWMWVEITRWRGKIIMGTLQNEPVDIRDLHAGQVVQVNEDDVFDYIRSYPDKHTEGNTTGKILERLESVPRSAPGHAEMPDCGL